MVIELKSGTVINTDQIAFVRKINIVYKTCSNPQYMIGWFSGAVHQCNEEDANKIKAALLGSDSKANTIFEEYDKPWASSTGEKNE